MTSLALNPIDAPQAPGAADVQHASAGRSAIPVTLGEAFATAQRAGDGDVFAAALNKDRRALVLSVRCDSAPGHPLRFSKVTVDLTTGAVLQLESFTFSTASELGRAVTCH